MWQQSWQSWKVQVSYNKGGEWDWCPSPQFHGLYSGFLDGSGLWVSSCQLKVSSCQPRVSLERTPWIPWLHCPAGVLLVTCLELPDSWKCHLSSLAICQSYPGWTLEFPGTGPGCDTIQTRTLDASWLLVPGCLKLHSKLLAILIWLVPMNFLVHPPLHWHAQSSLPIFSVWPIFSIICEKESSWIFTGIIFCILDWNFMVWPLDGVS